MSEHEHVQQETEQQTQLEQPEVQQEAPNGQALPEENIPENSPVGGPPVEPDSLDPVPSPTPTQPPKDVQAILNEMVWKHGSFVHQRPDFLALLKQWGLQKSDINKPMLKQAVLEAKKKAQELANRKFSPDDNQQLTWMPEPDEEARSSGERYFVWESKCGRYRVYYYPKAHPDERYAAQYITKEGSWDIFEHGDDGPGYPRFADSLEIVLIAVEKFHERETNTSILHTNREEVLAEESKLLQKQMITPVAIPIQSSSARTSTGNTGGTGSRGGRTAGLESQILAVLHPTTPMSPKQIKEAAGIDKSVGINSLMKRLGKENKVTVGYGAYTLHPAYVAQLQAQQKPIPIPEPEEKEQPEVAPEEGKRKE